MKKPAAKPNRDEMRAEYRFEYKQAKPNRFAARMKGGFAVVLDPDVAAVFDTTEKVNRFLRSTIKATLRQAA